MPDDLVGLPAYEVAIRPCIGGATAVPVTGRTLPLIPPTSDGTTLARASLSRFGTPRADVEAALRQRVQDPRRGGLFGRDEDGDLL